MNVSDENNPSKWCYQWRFYIIIYINKEKDLLENVGNMTDKGHKQSMMLHSSLFTGTRI